MEKRDIEYSKVSQERVITIGDLIKEIFRRFWIVIIAAAICAALLGGYKYVKDYKAAADALASTDLSEDTAESSLSEEEQKEVDNILLIQDNLQQQQDYTEHSILMDIDPYNESTVTLQYVFNAGQDTADSESRDYWMTLLNSYQSYVDNGMLVADLQAQGVDLASQYLGELITCEIQSEIGVNNNTQETIILGNPVRSFDIKVIHVDKDSCEKLAEKIAVCMEAYQLRLNDSVGAHQLVLVDESYSQVVDRDLWSYKFDRANSIVTMQEKIETLKENMSAEQISVIERYVEKSQETAEDIEETEESGDVISVGISKKYIAAGALGGIVLACLFIIICYIMRGTINQTEDLQYLYNMRILGEIDSGHGKNVFALFWNKLIGKKERKLSLEDQLGLLETNIRITCEKKQIQRLLICGQYMEEKELLKPVLECLKEHDVQVEYATDLLYSSEAFERLSEFDHIIFVEEIRKSQYTDIVKQIEICSEQQVEILGAIVLRA